MTGTIVFLLLAVVLLCVAVRWLDARLSSLEAAERRGRIG